MSVILSALIPTSQGIMSQDQHYRRQTFLSADALTTLEGLLERIAKDANAHLVLLADPTGQELAFYGRVESHIAETLSALSASQMGASHELVNALQFNSSFSVMIREGRDYNYFLVGPAEHYILLLVASTMTPLGWVRHILRQYLEELGTVLATIEETAYDSHAQQDTTPSEDWVSNILTTMDDFWEQS